ncbi:MAG TPA: serine hydrolase, partial [Opitutus sp.]|nr:serine hydrolase [Opitutus sp.]
VGATEQTNVSVFSVGRFTAVNQALFKPEIAYDGHADIAFIAIMSSNGKFGGIRAANTTFFAAKGFTGIYAPGVNVAGPLFIGDITAADAATASIVVGSANDARVTGGDLLQSNGRPVKVAGLSRLVFSPGTDSHGTLLPATANRGILEHNGTDITAQIVVNPAP